MLIKNTFKRPSLSVLQDSALLVPLMLCHARSLLAMRLLMGAAVLVVTACVMMPVLRWLWL